MALKVTIQILFIKFGREESFLLFFFPSLAHSNVPNWFLTDRAKIWATKTLSGGRLMNAAMWQHIWNVHQTAKCKEDLSVELRWPEISGSVYDYSEWTQDVADDPALHLPSIFYSLASPSSTSSLSYARYQVNCGKTFRHNGLKIITLGYFHFQRALEVLKL